MTDFTGRGIDRIDGRSKVTGKATYAADVAVANVLHAVIVGSAVAAGRLVGVDTSAAESASGVVAVLTPHNAPKLPGATRKGEPNERVIQALQDDAILYDGQPIAVVVADTLERAVDAASLVTARYDERRPSVEIEPELPSAYAPATAGPAGPAATSRGDFDRAFAAAAVRIEQTYTTPNEHHNPMEMHGTIAVWQGSDRLTVYDATQGVFGVRKRLAAVFDIPRENIRVISRFLGGGFGCKGSAWSHVALAAMAAKVTGRAVKLVLRRPQMFQLVGHRPRTIQKVSLGARPDGALVAARHEVVSHTSRFDEFTEPSAKLTRMLYACPNVKTSHRLVRLDVATPTFTRAPGEASGSFALESAMDELAYAVGIDPLELRLKNHADTDLDEKKPFSSKSLKACYQQGAERFGWSRRTPAVGSMRDGGALIGWGVATATYPANQWPASALARVRADGTAVVLAGSQDIGTGTYTIMTQIAADALGLPIEKVVFDLGDTALPETPVSGGSTTASSVGSAVKRAALAVRDQLVKRAVEDARSPLHGLAPDRIDAVGGKLISKDDPRRFDTHAEVLQRAGQREIEEKVDNAEKADRKGYSLHSFGAHFVEVRVDPDVLAVRVSRVVSAFAAGRILNAKTARSQFIGGIVWGVGLALEEHTVRDARTGRVVTKDLADYHVPVNADIGAIEVLTIAEDDPHVNEIGAKGIGEIGIVGAGAAIANAVYHATGKRIRDLPITPDKLIGA